MVNEDDDEVGEENEVDEDEESDEDEADEEEVPDLERFNVLLPYAERVYTRPRNSSKQEKLSLLS